MGTVRAMYKYGCSSFGHRSGEYRKNIERLDRRCAQCCSRLYRTSAYYSAGVLCGLAPLELELHHRLLRIRQQKGWSIVQSKGKCNVLQAPSRSLQLEKFKEELDKLLIKRWQELYTQRTSEWSRKLFPTVTTRPAVEVNFFLGQAITGHGCFRYFRWEIGKLPSEDCPECHTEETDPEHVLTKCPRFSEKRPAKLDVKKATSCTYMEETVKKLWKEENGPQSVRTVAKE